MTKIHYQDLEKEFNVIITDESVLNGEVEFEKEEFSQLLSDNHDAYLGCMWEDRIEFLTNNGYEITRENIADSYLTAKQPQ